MQNHIKNFLKQQWRLNTAIFITLFIAVVELVTGYLSNSLALISDSGHMFTDVIALFIALIAKLISTKPASDKHTYGYQRIEVIAALLNSTLMLIVIIGIIIESIARLHNPEHVSGAPVFIVAMIGLVANLITIFILSSGHQHHHDLNTKAAMLHVIGDLLGSIAAVIAGAVIYFTGWVTADPILSMLIVLIILSSNIKLLKESFLILMESVPKDIDFNKVSQEILHINGINTLNDLHIWTLSSGRVALSCHIRINDINQWPEILNNLKNLLNNTFNISHITIQPEI